MDGSPSLAAWVALAGLWGAVLLGFGLGVRARRRLERPRSVKPAAGELPDAGVVRGQQVSLALASAPTLVALLVGAAWPSILWWAIFALPASVAVSSLATPPWLALAARRRTGAVPPGQPAGPVVGAVAVAAVPVVAIALALAGSDVRLGVAVGLIAGYGLWRGAFAVR